MIKKTFATDYYWSIIWSLRQPIYLPNFFSFDTPNNSLSNLVSKATDFMVANYRSLSQFL
jgi:hypothetical protein